MNTLKVLFTIPLLTISLMSAPLLQAQEYENIGNVTLGGTAYFADSDRGIDDDAGLFLGGELPLANRWSLDANYILIDSEVELTGADADVDFIHLGLNYHLDQVNNWQPYVGIGFGNLDVDNAGPFNDMDDDTLNLGFGLKRFINDKWLLRGDIKFINGLDSHNWDQAVSFGISYAFGRRSAPASSPAPEPVAAAAPAPSPAPTPAPPMDSDNDGIIDSRDNCPDTPANLAVDASGCPILDVSQRRQVLQVNFDFNRSEVLPQYDAEIADFAGFMKTYANTTVVIEGHTDSAGPEEYNQDLSERRANAVRNELVNEYDIAADRISAVGYGESRPVDTNDTDAGRANNRRIEAVISVEVEQQRRR